MNNHEQQIKQTYESYKFQPLMSFWFLTHPQIHHHTSRHSLQTYRFHTLKFQYIITIYKT